MNRRLVAITGGVCVALLAVWYLTLWSPKGGELTSANDRRAAAEAQAQELQIRLARLQDAKSRSTQLVATRDRVHSAVPDTPALAQFILDADDAANQAGVDFLSIAPTQPAPDVAGPSKIAMGLTIRGGYFQVLDFMDRLLTLPRIVVVESLTVSVDGTNDGELAASLNAAMYTTQAVAPLTMTPAAATPAATPVSAPPTTAVAAQR